MYCLPSRKPDLEEGRKRDVLDVTGLHIFIYIFPVVSFYSVYLVTPRMIIVYKYIFFLFTSKNIFIK